MKGWSMMPADSKDEEIGQNWKKGSDGRHGKEIGIKLTEAKRTELKSSPHIMTAETGSSISAEENRVKKEHDKLGLKHTELLIITYKPKAYFLNYEIGAQLRCSGKTLKFIYQHILESIYSFKFWFYLVLSSITFANQVSSPH